MTFSPIRRFGSTLASLWTLFVKSHWTEMFFAGWLRQLTHSNYLFGSSCFVPHSQDLSTQEAAHKSAPPKKCKSKSLRDPRQALEKEDWVKFGEGSVSRAGLCEKVLRKLISLRDSRRGDSRQNKSRKSFEFQSRVTPKWVQSDPKVLPTSSPK